MTERQNKRSTYSARIADGFTIIFSFLLAARISDADGGFGGARHYAWILLVVFPAWYHLCSRFGIYESVRTRRPGELLLAVFKAIVAGAGIAMAAIYLFDPFGFRWFYLIFLVACTGLLLLQKTACLLIVKYWKGNDFQKRQIVIVGTGEKSARFIRALNQHPDRGLKINGLIRGDGENGQAVLSGCKVLGELRDLVDICRNSTVDEVVFCEWSGGRDFDDNLEALEEMGITVRLVLNAGNFRHYQDELSFFQGEFPILTVSSGPIQESHIVFKRFLDIVGSVVGVSILAVMFPFIAVAIKLESGGPVFYGQDRIGENGRIIKCWKFRSMDIDAEKRKMEISHLNEMKGGMFKLRNDPRVTRVGQVLRRTSLDEWPQFWNVLKGEMSLVGPRPLPIGDVRMVENRYRRRLSVKPGITGLWQVSGRSRVINFEEVVQFDLEYIDNWSLWLDCRILLKTCLVIFSGHGSY